MSVTIALAVPIAPDGEIIAESKDTYGCITLEVELEDADKKQFHYMQDRVPERFGKISER